MKVLSSDLQSQLEAMEKRFVAATDDRLGECLRRWDECRDLLFAMSMRRAKAEDAARGSPVSCRYSDYEAAPEDDSPAAPVEELREILHELRELRSQASQALSEKCKARDDDSSDGSRDGEGSDHEKHSETKEAEQLENKPSPKTDIWHLNHLLKMAIEDYSEESGEDVDQHTTCCARRGAAIEQCLRDVMGQPNKDGCLYKTSRSWLFQVFALMMTMANCIAVAIETDTNTTEALKRAMVGSSLDNLPKELWLQVTQRLFLAWLMFELVIQLLGTRVEFFLGPDRYWNFFDMVVMIVSLFTELDDSDGGGINSSYMRALRVAKITRAFRAVRFVRYSDSLQRMMGAALSVALSLLWTGCVMLIFVYIVGISMMEGVTNFLVSQPPALDPIAEKWRESQFALRLGTGGGESQGFLEALHMHYGGVGRTMVTLFRGITGSDWGAFAAPLHATNEIWGIVWIIYIFGALFGITHVATAIIVNIIKRPLPIDNAVRIAAESDEEKKLTKELLVEFKRFRTKPGKGDDDENEVALGKKTFTRFVNSPRVSRLLRSFGIDIERLGDVFCLCDQEGTGEVTLTTAATRLMMLRGGAKSQDMTRLAGEVRELKLFMESLNEIIQKGFMDARGAEGEVAEQPPTRLVV